MSMPTINSFDIEVQITLLKNLEAQANSTADAIQRLLNLLDAVEHRSSINQTVAAPAAEGENIKCQQESSSESTPDNPERWQSLTAKAKPTPSRTTSRTTSTRFRKSPPKAVKSAR